MLVLGGVGETVSIKPMKGDAIGGYVVKSIEKCLEISNCCSLKARELSPMHPPL